jgi:hypothetical protein
LKTRISSPFELRYVPECRDKARDDEELLLAFIKREAKDYGSGKPIEWTTAVTSKVMAEIRRLNARRISIISNSNLTGKTRALEFDLWHTGDNGKHYSISLCPCGNMNHLFFTREVKD